VVDPRRVGQLVAAGRDAGGQTDPQTMLAFLRGNVSERKLRLFACACCRQVWHLLSDERSRHAVEVAERHADGLASMDDLKAVSQQAWTSRSSTWESRGQGAAVGWTAREAIDPEIIQRIIQSTDALVKENQKPTQATLLRCIFGNPFRTASFSPALRTWHDGTLPKLAQAIYDDRLFPPGHLDNTRLAILADALEDAGCDNKDLLDHCRSGGEHVRGCWVVELLLGKE
jgi:hypothetical protein